ncbi:flagellar type III secretion system protein FlhB (plasmid) [Enterobacteriaceae bacterium Kacie_13]|nr:flagellar type III secretion system protein FlhB [Enterobacteriaceae bacterium Kacie_13]
MSEKNEKPTSKRLREARKRGQIAKSTELTSAIQLGSIALVFFFFMPDWLADVTRLVEMTLASASKADMDAILTIMVACGGLFIRIISVIGSVMLASILSIQLAQVGIAFSPGAFANVGQRINPLSNLKQMFSAASLFELFKSILKLCVVGGIFSSLLKGALPNVQHLSRCGPACGLTFTSGLVFRLFLGLLAAYVFFALADYAFQKRRITKQLMMNREEIKQEFKESEGSPEIKQQRKELHRELQNSGLKNNVRKSSFIIRNPTHIAICVWYHEKECPLPKILDKASDKQAMIAIELAEEAGIPMVENIPLARSLFKQIPVGEFITAEYYEEMAAVIHFVEKIQNIALPDKR